MPNLYALLKSPHALLKQSLYESRYYARRLAQGNTVSVMGPHKGLKQARPPATHSGAQMRTIMKRGAASCCEVQRSAAKCSEGQRGAAGCGKVVMLCLQHLSQINLDTATPC
eukprot:6173384-Pleurochrysis_carterae.AAC.1